MVRRPVWLATTNASASILVGSHRPFIQVQRTLPPDASSRDQVVQYKDETAFDAPVISTRSIIAR